MGQLLWFIQFLDVYDAQIIFYLKKENKYWHLYLLYWHILTCLSGLDTIKVA